MKLDKSQAYAWGIYGYLPGNYRNGRVSRLALTHISADEGFENNAINKACQYTKERGGVVYLPYFVVPSRRSVFGDVNNKGIVGFAYKGKFIRFEKPLGFFDALKQVDEQLISGARHQ